MGRSPDAELTDSYLASLCVGLDVYRARIRLMRAMPDLERKDIEISYFDSNGPRFCVTECRRDRKREKILLRVISANPIRHLPSNYQNDDFLRKYLMIFQHVFNDTTITLDNLHEYFRPMECPSNFLPTLADWFGIHLDTLGGEDEVRRFLQYAIPLYRFRGTSLGLRIHLSIVSGVMPKIIEGEIPYSAMEIIDNGAIDTSLFDDGIDDDCFTVFFPVLRKRFDDTLVRRLSLIVQQEKPVHTRSFLGFMKSEIASRKVTTIVENTTIDAEGGINF